MTDKENVTDIVDSKEEEFDDTAYAPVTTEWRDEPEEEESDLLRMKILQSNSPEVLHEDEPEGHFYIEGYPALGQEILVVPLRHATTRILFDDEEENVDCQSPNGKIGIGTPGGDCKTCPLSKWGENKEKPECMERKSFLFYVLGADTIAQWDAASTAFSTGKRIRALIRGRGNKVAIPIKMRLKQTTRGRYSYFVPSARLAKEDEIPEDLAETLEGIEALTNMAQVES